MDGVSLTDLWAVIPRYALLQQRLNSVLVFQSHDAAMAAAALLTSNTQKEYQVAKLLDELVAFGNDAFGAGVSWGKK
jgi:hypothetical protein